MVKGIKLSHANNFTNVLRHLWTFHSKVTSKYLWILLELCICRNRPGEKRHSWSFSGKWTRLFPWSTSWPCPSERQDRCQCWVCGATGCLLWTSRCSRELSHRGAGWQKRHSCPWLPWWPLGKPGRSCRRSWPRSRTCRSFCGGQGWCRWSCPYSSRRSSSCSTGTSERSTASFRATCSHFLSRSQLDGTDSRTKKQHQQNWLHHSKREPWSSGQSSWPSIAEKRSRFEVAERMAWRRHWRSPRSYSGTNGVLSPAAYTSGLTQQKSAQSQPWSSSFC